ncbi:hypothetical protein KGF57_002418 [Candida theae]|uniref:Uncharacterized protein n=1 Tax=Candida theae TaxID=1198502 RepID=A0AAD5BEZ0_9ASCO|nr:uncharacterized protein KGF57_002418 [Candida theae]KAI5958573.1 hypothetical protein KGF57_002418 [Candida theae]
MSYTIPDLRFEQSFMRQLNAYAGNKELDGRHSALNPKNYNPLPKLTDGELELLNENVDKEEEEYLEDPEPLKPITPRIVIFAIVKDQIVLPLLQGFFITGFLISVRPILALLVKNGQHAGTWVSNLLGLNRLTTNRSSRNPRGTAYTGVNPNTNNPNKPHAGALAAALTIGNAMKQGNQSQSIPRSQSFQYQQPQTQQRTPSLSTSNGSLLKRGSRSSFQPQQPQAPAQRRLSNGSFSSQGSINRGATSQAAAYYNSHHPEVYDVDDSFNDSYLDEITEESTQVYLNNKANMQDLRLPTAHSQGHGFQASAVPPAPVRMVKKYVPSPTGIKVIEVPESTFQKEVARSNSMRLNPISSRSGSLRNSANKKPASRTSSLNIKSQQKPVQSIRNVSSPVKMQSMNEDINLEDSLGRIDTAQAQEAKLKALEAEIEREKQLAKQLEEKRLEYQRLREQNLANERKEKELDDSSIEKNTIENKKESSYANDDEYIPIIEKTKAVDELDKKELEHDKEGEEEKLKNLEQTEPELSEQEIDQPILSENNAASTSSLNDSVVYNVPKPPQSEGNIDHAADIADSEFSPEDEGNIRVAVIVDNADDDEGSTARPHSQNFASDIEVVSDYDDEGEEVNKARTWKPDDTDRLDADSEMRVIAQYGMNSSELVDEIPALNDGSNAVETSTRVAGDGKVSSEVIEPHTDDDPNAGTINSKVESADTLLPPTVATVSSSKSSVYSNDLAKKPMKSAMKSSSSYSQLPAKQGPSPAHANSNAAKQAYLSLTTAENTRLNSKLSNSELPNQAFPSARPQVNVHSNDLAYLGASNGGAYPQFATSPQLQKTPAKRLSQQTLRKQQPPPQQHSQFRSTMRPQSMAGHGTQYQQQHQQQYQQHQQMHPPQHNLPQSMSNRSLRNSTYVQPIAPHPALQKGYVSPAKVKAADLYAKAQSRPRSEFRPLKKQSSFTKELSDDVPPRSPSRDHNTGTQSKPQPRTTLRNASGPLVAQNNENQQQAITQRANVGGAAPSSFASRFADSDDDLPLKNGASGNTTGFKSRFNDSDEHLPKVAAPAAQSSTQTQSGFSTMRADKDAQAPPPPPPKEKKKFGGKLRKLFQSKN